MPKTRYQYRVYAVINKADASALNTKAERYYGRGPGTGFFSRGVSATGDAPAQAYVASFVATGQDILLWVKHMLDNYPKSYLYVAARGKFGGTKEKLAKHIDINDYRNEAWQTREKGFGGLVDDDASLEDVLAQIALDSTPSMQLQPINE